MTILIADDSEKNRELLYTVLTHLGHQVVQASNGADAVELAQRHRPDILILDLQMPILDGFGAVRQLRGDPAFERTPILALTAYAMEGDREKALTAGFSAFLAKPLRLADLRRELRVWQC